MELAMMQLEAMEVLLRKLFLEYLAMIIQFLLKFLKHPSCAMDKLMVVIMLIQKLSVKHSISVPMMEMED